MFFLRPSEGDGSAVLPLRVLYETTLLYHEHESPWQPAVLPIFAIPPISLRPVWNILWRRYPITFSLLLQWITFTERDWAGWETWADRTGMGGLGFVLKVCFAICILADILFYISFFYFSLLQRHCAA